MYDYLLMTVSALVGNTPAKVALSGEGRDCFNGNNKPGADAELPVLRELLQDFQGSNVR